MKNSVIAYLASHHHTAVCVSNWERSVAFYESLGFQIVNDWLWPDGSTNHKSLLRFRDKQNCWLEPFEYPEGAGQLTERFRMAPGAVYSYVMAVYGKTDVDFVYEHALSHGGAEVEAPHEVLWQGTNGSVKSRIASVSDPDGAIFSFRWDDSRGEAGRGPGLSAADRMIGFDYQLLRVSSLERSVSFYDALGFNLQGVYTEEGSGIRMALMRLDDGSGLLLRQEHSGEIPTDKERLRTPGGLFQYCFWVPKPEGIDQIYGYCVGLGARERMVPFYHDGYGLKHWADHPAFVYGPDDEILEFLNIDYKEG